MRDENPKVKKNTNNENHQLKIKKILNIFTCKKWEDEVNQKGYLVNQNYTCKAYEDELNLKEYLTKYLIL